MKTWKNLHPKICSFENLLIAAKSAQRGKRYRPEVFQFNSRLEENLIQLQQDLRTLTWEPGQYRDFYVKEAKRRLISAAPYRDRVVHHAICNVIEPLFDKTFIFDSYACRQGKGTHAAANRYTEFSHRAKYVLKCDVSRYFQSIRHEVIHASLARKIADLRALRLCESVIRSHGDEGLLWPAGHGIPIGNLTSQFFANLYLNEFDHWMKEQMKCEFYIRYVDDFVVLANDKKWLHSLIPRIEAFFESLGLTLHPRKRSVFPVTEGCDFMGYRIWPTHRRIRPMNGYRFQRRFKLMARDYGRGKNQLGKIQARIASWIGHARNADSWALRRAIFEKVNFRRDAINCVSTGG